MSESAVHRPVLVGIDDQGSPAALRWAADEAARRSVSLRVLNVCSSAAFQQWGFGIPLPAADLQAMEQSAHNASASLLADAAEKARDAHPGLNVETTVAEGSAAAALVAASEDSSSVVVGSRRPHHHLAGLGSVSLAVSAHADCPVVVVPDPAGAPGGSPSRPAGAVVVGVDDTDECADAVELAFAQASGRGVELRAVHTWWVDLTMVPPSMTDSLREIDDSERAAAERFLAPWRERYPSVPVTMVLERSDACSVLVDAAQDAALLVVGSRGRGGFASLLLGSVSRRVLQHAPCPVAVVRRGQLGADALAAAARSSQEG